ncbi:MAG: alpha/beta hydrolase, partial [Anaerolineae bacterium]|nr:alpha/beta hydrolase [Anaerolineae bacterium]
MSAVVINGGLVHYEAFGRGRPVIFLHGWLGSWRYWMSTMESIADKHRTFAIDLWGFGDSDKSKPRYQLDDYVDLIDKFLENRGMSDTPLTVIGHGLGATVALKYATDFPKRIQKAMTISLPMTAEAINRRVLDPSGNTSMMSRVLSWRQQTVIHKEVQQEAEKTSSDAIKISIASFEDMALEERIPSRIQAISQT